MSTLPRRSQIEKSRHDVCQKIREMACADRFTVVEHKSGNAPEIFEEKLAKTGLAIVVGIKSAEEAGSQSKTIYWRPVTLFVHVVESPLNASSDTQEIAHGAWSYAEEVVSALKLASIDNMNFPMIHGLLEELPAAREENLVVGFELVFNTEGNTRATSN